MNEHLGTAEAMVARNHQSTWGPNMTSAPITSAARPPRSTSVEPKSVNHRFGRFLCVPEITQPDAQDDITAEHDRPQLRAVAVRVHDQLDILVQVVSPSEDKLSITS